MSYRGRVQADSDAGPDPHPKHLFLSHKVSRGQFTGFCFNINYIRINIGVKTILYKALPVYILFT
jgi:hypothetical protein